MMNGNDNSLMNRLHIANAIARERDEREQYALALARLNAARSAERPVSIRPIIDQFRHAFPVGTLLIQRDVSLDTYVEADAFNEFTRQQARPLMSLCMRKRDEHGLSTFRFQTYDLDWRYPVSLLEDCDPFSMIVVSTWTGVGLNVSADVVVTGYLGDRYSGVVSRYDAVDMSFRLSTKHVQMYDRVLGPSPMSTVTIPRYDDPAQCPLQRMNMMFEVHTC